MVEVGQISHQGTCVAWETIQIGLRFQQSPVGLGHYSDWFKVLTKSSSTGTLFRLGYGSNIAQ